MNICYLALGSNLKSPERQIRLAIQQLRQLSKTRVISIAPLYINPAIGRRAQPIFCNTVLKILTTLKPIELLDACQLIEKSQERVRRVRWGARTIDIDILYFGHRQIQTPRLTIPHPFIHERDFVSIPLKQLSKIHATSADNR